MQAGDTENAFAVFHELCEMSSSPSVSGFKLRPTLRTFGSLLHACARSGEPLLPPGGWDEVKP